MKREDIVTKANEGILEFKKNLDLAGIVDKDLEKLKPFLDLVPLGAKVAEPIEKTILEIVGAARSLDYEVVAFFVDKIDADFDNNQTTIFFKMALLPFEAILLRFKIEGAEDGVYLSSKSISDNDELVAKLKAQITKNKAH